MTACMCAKSATMLHNETLNSWTHILGGLYFFYQLVMIGFGIGPFAEFKSSLSYVLMIIATLAASFAMIASATYHLFNVLGKE